MISDTARFHGSFFVLLFECLEEAISIERLPAFGAGYYLLAKRVPVYLKFSTKRKGPWTFNFVRAHQEAQQRLYAKFGECYTCMICGSDGVVGLSMGDFRKVLDADFGEQESVSVRRKLRSRYEIRGRDGILERRVARQAIFQQIRNTVRLTAVS